MYTDTHKKCLASVYTIAYNEEYGALASQLNKIAAHLPVPRRKGSSGAGIAAAGLAAGGGGLVAGTGLVGTGAIAQKFLGGTSAKTNLAKRYSRLGKAKGLSAIPTMAREGLGYGVDTVRDLGKDLYKTVSKQRATSAAAAKAGIRSEAKTLNVAANAAAKAVPSTVNKTVNIAAKGTAALKAEKVLASVAKNVAKVL